MAAPALMVRSAMVARVLGLFGRKGEDEHGRARNLASDYIDGELDADTTSSIKSHLDMCAPCRSFLRDFEGNDQLAAVFKGAGRTSLVRGTPARHSAAGGGTEGLDADPGSITGRGDEDAGALAPAFLIRS